MQRHHQCSDCQGAAQNARQGETSSNLVFMGKDVKQEF
jgi:hypothetical protein